MTRLVPTSAVSLGVVRLVVHGAFLISVMTTSFSTLGELPVTVVRPAGVMKLLPWAFYDHLLTPSGMTLLKVVTLVSLGLGAAGLFTAVSTKASLVLVVLFQGLVRSLGHYNHDEMLGVLFFGVLAFTPCGDALSLDRHLFGPRRPRPGFAYGYPILLMRSLLAWVYFSSALIKLRVSGLTYLSPDNLPVLAIYHSLDNLHDTAFRYAFWLPEVRSSLGVVGGLVLLWELLFPLAVFSRRCRWGILAFGVVFHLSTLFLMNVFFPHTLAMYLVFVDWDAVAARLVKPSAEERGTIVNRGLPA